MEKVRSEFDLQPEQKYVHNLLPEAKRRYFVIIVGIDGIDPHAISTQSWSANPALLPDANCISVENYFRQICIRVRQFESLQKFASLGQQMFHVRMSESFAIVLTSVRSVSFLQK